MFSLFVFFNYIVRFCYRERDHQDFEDPRIARYLVALILGLFWAHFAAVLDATFLRQISFRIVQQKGAKNTTKEQQRTNNERNKTRAKYQHHRP